MSGPKRSASEGLWFLQAPAWIWSTSPSSRLMDGHLDQHLAPKELGLFGTVGSPSPPWRRGPRRPVSVRSVVHRQTGARGRKPSRLRRRNVPGAAGRRRGSPSMSRRRFRSHRPAGPGSTRNRGRSGSTMSSGRNVGTTRPVQPDERRAGVGRERVERSVRRGQELNPEALEEGSGSELVAGEARGQVGVDVVGGGRAQGDVAPRKRLRGCGRARASTGCPRRGGNARPAPARPAARRLLPPGRPAVLTPSASRRTPWLYIRRSR